MIKPTIGCKVWYFEDPNEQNMTKHGDQPFDATVVFVWSDTCVNLLVLDHEGYEFRKTSVPINIDAISGTFEGEHAEWMPYQISQAKKHEEETK